VITVDSSHCKNWYSFYKWPWADQSEIWGIYVPLQIRKVGLTLS